ncbi:hypothetical protein EDB84DRAFT_968037 [Lactarius hengduanensis]|nr:hypothetical protein EDB84DRAFT_968037 [Lactarius hengduanensis]
MASAASVSPPSPSSSRVACTLALGTTSPHSKPSCVVSTSILLSRALAPMTSERPCGGSSSFARRVSQIWVVLARGMGGARNSNSILMMAGSRTTAMGTSGVLPLPGSRGHVFRGPDDPHDPGRGPNATPQLKGKHKEDIDVLGIIMPHDIDMLERESRTGRGWIACTTDTVFLEKPQYCDMIINLTSYAPEPAARDQEAVRSQADIPPLHHALHPDRRKLVRASRAQGHVSPSLAQWTGLDLILQLDADPNGVARAHRSSAPVWAWTDAWGVYEVVCVVCARLYLGLWNSSSRNGASTSHDQ